MYLVIFFSEAKYFFWKVYCMSFQMRYSFLSYGKLPWRYNFLKCVVKLLFARP